MDTVAIHQWISWDMFRQRHFIGNLKFMEHEETTDGFCRPIQKILMNCSDEATEWNKALFTSGAVVSY